MTDQAPGGDGRGLESADDLYENAPCGYLSTLPDGTIVRVNRTFLEWTGFRREDLVDRRRFQDLLTAGGRIYHETHVAPLLHMQGRVREIAAEIDCPGGRRLPILVNATLRSAPDGSPLAIRTTVFNASDRRRYEEELLRAQQRATASEQRVRLLRAAADRMASASTVADVAHALEEVAVEGVPAVEGARVTAARDGAEAAPALRQGSSSAPGEAIEVPLVAADHPVGLLTVRVSRGQSLDEAALDVVNALARQAGPAIERARLYERAVEEARRAELLTAIISAVIQVDTVAERAALLERLCVPELADAAHVVLGDEQRHRAADAPAGDRVQLPLAVGGQPLGTIELTRRPPRRFGEAELELLRELADRVAFALGNAQLLERERSIAHTLQAALLAGQRPRDPRFTVATLYRPAERHLDVGGDWFDIFTLGHDRVGIVVGDVVGRGIHAASAMGQLRSATRAVAGFEVGPARVIERLDGFIENLPSARMATVVYAEIDLRARIAIYACAGHLPPALLPAGGDARFLWDGRSAPLGFPSETSSRPEAQVAVAPGESLILYTDGLVERRGEPIDEGLDRLLAALGKGQGKPPERLLEIVTAELEEDVSSHDDRCVLCLRVEPS
jgi:serine/threonine-protein kinase RsbW